MGRSLSDAWNAGLQLSHYLKILNPTVRIILIKIQVTIGKKNDVLPD